MQYLVHLSHQVEQPSLKNKALYNAVFYRVIYVQHSFKAHYLNSGCH